LLLFEYDRTRPSIDLLARVRFKDRSRYIDLGCGPGNSTKLVDKRFPNAPLSALPNGCARQTHETAEF
jgi:trans-aconitate 2-methyltransferase